MSDAAPDDAMPTPLSPEDYAAAGGRSCPSCEGTDIARGGCMPRGPQMVTRSLNCENCGATWIAVYTLSGYEGPVRAGEAEDAPSGG